VTAKPQKTANLAVLSENDRMKTILSEMAPIDTYRPVVVDIEPRFKQNLEIIKDTAKDIAIVPCQSSEKFVSSLSNKGLARIHCKQILGKRTKPTVEVETENVPMVEAMSNPVAARISAQLSRKSQRISNNFSFMDVNTLWKDDSTSKKIKSL
jgi:hypothetical protein